jgi:hypothetical protein
MDRNMVMVEIGSSIGRAASPKLPPTAPDVAARALCSRLEAALGSFFMVRSATESAAPSALVVAAATALEAASGEGGGNHRARMAAQDRDFLGGRGVVILGLFDLLDREISQLLAALRAALVQVLGDRKFGESQNRLSQSSVHLLSILRAWYKCASPAIPIACLKLTFAGKPPSSPAPQLGRRANLTLQMQSVAVSETVA